MQDEFFDSQTLFDGHMDVNPFTHIFKAKLTISMTFEEKILSPHFYPSTTYEWMWVASA